MAEYIEREAAICVADYAVDEHPYDKIPGNPETFSEYNQGWHDACDYIMDRLESLSAADAVKVVRCKDCKHWKHFDHLGCTDFVKVCGLANYMIGATGYCLYGERRVDNADD